IWRWLQPCCFSSQARRRRPSRQSRGGRVVVLGLVFIPAHAADPVPALLCRAEINNRQERQERRNEPQRTQRTQRRRAHTWAPQRGTTAATRHNDGVNCRRPARYAFIRWQFFVSFVFFVVPSSSSLVRLIGRGRSAAGKGRG